NSIEFLYNIEEEKQAFLDVNFISRKIKNLKLKDGWQNIYLDTITSLISMSEKLDDENSY
ncbi:hypothetical protein DZC41_05665, partial [Acinetobacter haemolyticus]